MSREPHDRPEHKQENPAVNDKPPHRLHADAAVALTNPESKLPPTDKSSAAAGIPKDFGNHQIFDMSSVPSPYGDKVKTAGNTAEVQPPGGAHSLLDDRPSGGAHTMSDNTPTGDAHTMSDGKAVGGANTMSDKKPVDDTHTMSGDKSARSAEDNANVANLKKANDAIGAGKPDGRNKELAQKGPSDDTKPVVEPIPDPPAKPESAPVNDGDMNVKPGSGGDTYAAKPGGDKGPSSSIWDTWAHGIGSIVYPGS